MLERSKIVETFEWVQNNCSGAVRSFCIGYPLWESSVHVDIANQTRFTTILQTIADQLPRYSAICMVRVWDTNSESKSIFKLKNQMSQHKELRSSAEFQNICAAIDDYVKTDSARVLRTMRDKMFAHTEGVATDHTNSLPLVEFAAVIDLTVLILDKCQTILMPEKSSYMDLVESWMKDRNLELQKMLEILAKAEN